MNPTRPHLWVSFIGLIASPTTWATTPIKIGFPLEVALGNRETLELEFPTEIGKIYQVEVSADLKKWAFDGYAVVGTGGPRTHITTTRNLPQLFFRVRNDGDPTRVLAGGVPGPPGAPGPQGPQGPAGTAGLDPANFATSAQGAKADTALQPGYMPISDEAQAFWAALNGTTLRDRFDRSERYAEGQRISHLTAIPEIGPAWRLATINDTDELKPYIDKGAFRSAENTICYLGNSVASPGKKFSLFFEFSLEPTGVGSPGFRLGVNVSFDSNTMITGNGEILPGGVVHINWDDAGIKTIDFFNNVQGYAADHTENTLRVTSHQFRTGEGFKFISGTPPSPLQLDTAYFAQVISETDIAVAETPDQAFDGEIIDLTTIGTVPHVLSYIHEPFSAINRERVHERYHWHPGRNPLIPNKRYVMFINADGENLEIGIAGVGSILFKNSQLPSHIGANTTNFWWEPGGATSGGGIQYPLIGKLHSVWSLPDLNISWLSSFGDGQQPSHGRAPMTIDNQLIEPVRSSAAASNALLKSVKLTPALETGDSEEIEYFGVLNGTLPKRILLTAQIGGQVLFDSDAIAPPLTQVEGPFTITLTRHVRLGGANTCFVRLQTASENHLHRSPLTAMENAPGNLDFSASAVPEGGVTLEAIKQVVYRAKNH